MEPLTHADLVGALDVAGRVVGVEDIYRHVLEATAPLFGHCRCSSELYRFVPGSIRREEGVICAPITPRLDEVFHAMVLGHPYAEAMASLCRTRVLQAPSAATGGRRFHEYPIYHEFYRAIDVKDQIVLGGAAGGPRMYVFSIGRDAPFTPREAALVRVLQPHVVSAWSNWSALRAADAAIDRRDAGLRAARLGVLEVDGSGRVVHGSADAAALVERHFPPARRDAGALPRPLQRWVREQAAKRPPATRRPPADAADAAGSLAAPPEAGRFASPSGVLRVRLAASREPDRFLLVLRETPHDPGPDPLRSLGLTKAQAQVLHSVARGLSNKQAAAHLGISPRTVGSHLEAIYRRLGVQSRAAATRLAMQLLHE